MAQEDLERLNGRAVLDPEFRARLLADPEKAKATLEEMAALAGQPWG
jgi:hypothetical protein